MRCRSFKNEQAFKLLDSKPFFLILDTFNCVITRYSLKILESEQGFEVAVKLMPMMLHLSYT